MSKRPRQSQLSSFFHKECDTKPSKNSKNNKKVSPNELAEYLSLELDAGVPNYLTCDGASWILHMKQWFPSPDEDKFQAEWDSHPKERKIVSIFGRKLPENRWSQAWGKAIHYSGLKNEATNIHDSFSVPLLLDKVNNLMKNSPLKNGDQYNACLENWYEPDSMMGLHSDDEEYLRPEFPIFSVSWGGSRRFLLRSKHSDEMKELWLDDGDLLVMGGTTQKTHKHEVPKHRLTDARTSNRINWTIRAVL